MTAFAIVTHTVYSEQVVEYHVNKTSCMCVGERKKEGEGEKANNSIAFLFYTCKTKVKL